MSDAPVVFLSTPSVWRATPAWVDLRTSNILFLSTPSVWRATADLLTLLKADLFLSTPSVWRATAWVDLHTSNILFLSTPSVWRATPDARRRRRTVHHFYPRPPCGGRPLQSKMVSTLTAYFYPRPPCGGRRAVLKVYAVHAFIISIHALRVEGDLPCVSILWSYSHFYPRPPCGGRLRVV